MNADDVGVLLDKIPAKQLFISDFSFHSICVVLSRLGQLQLLTDFIDDVIVPGDIQVLPVSPSLTFHVLDAVNKFSLDFDDAYQYVVALQNELTIVTFDRDFERTVLGRQTPAQVLASISR